LKNNDLSEYPSLLTREMANYFTTWWNLENLFDSENAPRTDKLSRVLKKELEGWSDEILEKKINQLVKMLRTINGSNGPDILGVCEVENENVLKKFRDSLQQSLGRGYKIIHSDTQDERGIDVAFLYDKDKFAVDSQKVFFHVIVKRYATRDIVQANFRSKISNTEFVLVGNHWPSRSGGQLESEPYRMMAGETLAYFNQRIQDVHGQAIPILVMGDFNDEPFNRSITDYAKSTVSADRVLKARSVPWLYNFMWETIGSRVGTFYYSDVFNVLDQFMVSRGMLIDNAKLKVQQGSLHIEVFTEMSRNGIPRKFGRPAEALDQDGYSDHFPISLVLVDS
jgi:predicted extracellular nuclease